MSDPTELREMLALTREFAAAELRPQSERWDREGGLGDDTMAQLAELGFLGMAAPESAGGMGLDRASVAAAVAQLAWGEASAGMAVALHAQVTAMVARAASEAARQQWLPPLATGQLIGCASVAGGGTGAVEAAAADGGWVLNGSLDWVGNARGQGLLALVAEAAPGPVLCLVPLAADGVGLEAPAATLGLRPLALRTVALRGVRVAGEAVLLGPGLPPAEYLAQAEDAAVSVAAVAVGIAQAALDHARDYATVREQFGRRLRDFEGIAQKLADMVIRVTAARALLERAGGASDPAAVPVAKVAAAEAAMYVSTQAVQVFGGYGYMRDYPVEKLMRDGKAMSLLGGADEWQRARIAELLYAE